MKKIPLLVLFGLICLALAACGEKPAGAPGDTSSAQPDPAEAPDEITGYYEISREEYLDKTAAGYVSKLVSFTTDYKFVWNKDGTPRIALPDEWYRVCAGSDTPNNPYHQKVAKLFYNGEEKLYELWIADAFGIDILDQYILRDMFEKYGTVTTKTITEDWVKYDVYDMGGGQRSVGAYALAKNKSYVSPFLGRAEYGNRYPWCEEPWIENNTLGMVAAGMPNAALDLSAVFTPVTGDSDNVYWGDFIIAMYSMAYFESDIPALIRNAAQIFPEDSWQRTVVEMSFDLWRKYPDDWRSAIVEAEKTCTRRGYYYHTDRALHEQGRVDINIAFSLLALLYGDGDFLATSRIFSLSGYDARGVMFLPVLGIIGGLSSLPEEAHEKIWQDGKGYIVNKPVEETKDNTGLWMCHLGNPERYYLSDLMEMFRENFEKVLLASGGRIEGDTYYVPKTAMRVADTLKLADPDFESGTLDSWTVKGNASLTSYAYFGDWALQVNGAGEGTSEAYTTLTGLIPGKTYRASFYAIAAQNATALIYARAPGAEGTQHVSVSGQSEYVRRELVFTALGETMELGLMLRDEPAYRCAILDDLRVERIFEQTPEGIGEVTVSSKTAEDGSSTGRIRVKVEGSHEEEEVFLKVNFANPGGSIVDGAISVNSNFFGAVPFYKTGDAGEEGSRDYVYIPVVLRRESNSVDIDVGSDSIILYGAEVVTVKDRLRTCD